MPCYTPQGRLARHSLVGIIMGYLNDYMVTYHELSPVRARLFDGHEKTWPRAFYFFRTRQPSVHCELCQSLKLC